MNDSVGQDLRYAVRALRKRPAVTLVALLTLAIGIGANTAIFSVVNGVLLRPVPYPHADRLVSLWERRPTGERNALTTRNYLGYAESTVFERVAATTGCCGIVTLGQGPSPMALSALRVSASYFDILGASAALGRTFAAGDDQPGRDRVVVLSHALWSSRFGADAALIGRSIRLDGEQHTVIGVMPADTPFDRSWVQIWLPLAFGPERMSRIDHWLIAPTGGALALLEPGVTLQQARAEMEAISARLSLEYPDTNTGWSVLLEPYAAILVGPEVKGSLYLLLGAVGLVLLLACVNLANVMLTRGVAREREVAIRVALGAGRERIVRHFLTEAILVSLSGGAMGCALAYATLPILTAVLPPGSVPPEATIVLDARVLIFSLLISLIAGVACGLGPAVWSTRRMGGAIDLQHRAARRESPRRIRSILVVTQIALAFVLVSGAGLLIRSFFEMRRADPGFATANLMTAHLPIREQRFADPEQLTGYLARIAAAAGTLPGVIDVSLTDGMPFQGAPTGMFFQIEGRPIVDRARRPVCDFKRVSGGYFRALDLRVRRGRGLDARDRRGSPYVTVINETMARSYFPGEDPVGQHIRMQVTRPGTTDEIPWEVVGVIADERVRPSDASRRSTAYVPIEQSPTGFAALIIRTALDAAAIEPAVRHAVFTVDKDQAVTDMKTVDELKSESMASDRLRSALLGAFAAVAVGLAAIGLYGVISHAVTERRREIGIRAALGATPAKLVTLVFRDGMRLTLIGLGAGFAGALAATRLLEAFLFGVGAADPITIALTSAILGIVAAGACSFPARAAARVDPLAAIRSE